jgi:serine/threonine protein kinase/Flp pilus assembly protein TadD
MSVKCPKCHSDNPDDTIYCGKCATPLEPSEDIPARTETIEAPIEELIRGTTLADRYEIIDELGKGGMGRVYRVEDTKLKQEIALKLIKPEIAKDKKSIERFRNELKIARNIRHKNVCGMFDLGEAGEAHFITMEYVRGEDLKSFIHRSRQLTIGTAIRISKQVCEGLAEAHKLGVVHRDLKSSNIMIDKEGNVRIMDFGIARSLESKGITGAGVMIGTPEYMSPEQVEAKEVDQRSDIYSLGVILYEMVTGRVPFEGGTPFTIGVKHKSEAPISPNEINVQIPEDLNHVILKCLEKDKELRFQSALELRSELENIEKGIPTTEREAPQKKPLTSKEITVTFGLKKLVLPILVLIGIIAIGVVLWQLLSQQESVPTSLGNSSIAVLPFVDLSQEKDQEYFCDGMTDELIAKLSKLEGLKVIPRTSMMRYKNTEKDITGIGQELKVTSILEGSVRKEKEDIRVIASLINVTDNSQLWSETYDQRLESVFAIQSNIAEEISNALLARLSPDEKEKLKKSPTENLEAFNLYHQGRYFWNKRTSNGMNKAIEYFEQAVEKDQSYALAYAGMADVYNMLASYGLLHPREAYPKSRAAALKALEVDENLAEAYSSLAFIKHYFDLDRTGSELDYKRAIALNPNYAAAHNYYAELLMQNARWKEALAEQQKAQELDPFSLPIKTTMGAIYYFARDYDKAIKYCREAIEMDPSFHWSHAVLGDVYIQKSMYKEAIIEEQKASNLSGNSIESLVGLASAHGFAGNKEEAMRILDDLLNRSRLEYVSVGKIALIYVSIGERDEAFKTIQNAIEEKDISYELLNLKVDPKMDSLRSDPRFADLLKKLGLEQ